MKRVPLIHIIIATGFGSGFSPFAPGTAGALLATLIWLALSCAVSPTLLLIITALLIGIFTIAGIRSANAVEPIWGEDPSRVVVDEMVGTWIALLAVPENGHWGYMIAAFALFRFFDILKPLGIRKMEKLPGGYGIMADDILSGIYGMIVILIFRLLV